MANKCLITAPLDFMPDVLRQFEAVMPTGWPDIASDVSIYTHWIPDPNQDYVIDASMLSPFDRLRYIITPSTGVTHIDMDACAERGITVKTLLDKRQMLNEITASSEYTFMLILEMLRQMTVSAKTHKYVRGRELAGKSVGLIGYGRIGRNVARWCREFRADVLLYDPYEIPRVIWPSVTLEYYEQAKYVHAILPDMSRDNPDDDDSIVPRNYMLTGLFERADIVVICCSLTDETRGMVDRNLLKLMKPDARLVNTARGEVINERDLGHLLDWRPQMRVALDVLSGEATGAHKDSPLWRHINSGRAIYTGHSAGMTEESNRKAALIALELLKESV